ncbi:MAG: alpha/beta hydrolase-fold protein [Ignavibacteriaceae bacterium]
MSPSIKLISLVYLTSAGFFFLSAQNFNLYNTEEKMFPAKSVEDTFHIFISLPDNYADSDEAYPVLYVLDGDVAFGMAASIARYFEIGGNIPELIIVGIGYGSIDRSSGNKSRRDYRPTAEGGAENFLLFLKDELIPYIVSSYRTIPDDRAISGYSSGGLFALYTLFTQPETFSRYIVGSPYLVWDDFSIYGYEENSPDKIGDMELNLFISVGSEESDEKYYNPIDSLVTKIQERNYSGLILETKVFEGSTHLMGPPEALTYGLLSVFSYY